MKTNNVSKLTILAAATLLSMSAYANTSSDNSAAASSKPATVQNNTVVVPDATLTTNVKAAFAADKAVSKLNVHVKTLNGIVKLSGHINTDNEASALIQDANSVTGVKDVDASKLVVKKEHAIFYGYRDHS